MVQTKTLLQSPLSFVDLTYQPDCLLCLDFFQRKPVLKLQTCRYTTATAAVQAINSHTSVQAVDMQKLKSVSKTDPLPDGTTPEILVDNDDVEHIQTAGDLKKEKTGSYGPSLYTAASGQTGSVKFSPDIQKAGRYHVYAYFPQLKNATAKTSITLSDGKATRDLVINEKDIRVEGQTAGEWVSLGTHSLQKGRAAYVSISTKGADGLVAAHAILFVPE